jgi:hypothetical protein
MLASRTPALDRGYSSPLKGSIYDHKVREGTSVVWAHTRYQWPAPS